MGKALIVSSGKKGEGLGEGVCRKGSKRGQGMFRGGSSLLACHFILP